MARFTTHLVFITWSLVSLSKTLETFDARVSSSALSLLLVIMGPRCFYLFARVSMQRSTRMSWLMS